MRDPWVALSKAFQILTEFEQEFSVYQWKYKDFPLWYSIRLSFYSYLHSYLLYGPGGQEEFEKLIGKKKTAQRKSRKK